MRYIYLFLILATLVVAPSTAHASGLVQLKLTEERKAELISLMVELWANTCSSPHKKLVISALVANTGTKDAKGRWNLDWAISTQCIDSEPKISSLTN